MNLDKFQQYVKDNKLEADYSAEDGNYLLSTLKHDCKDAYDEIMDEVVNNLDLLNIVEWTIEGDEHLVTQEIELKSKSAVNAQIKYALEAIEDIWREKSQDDADSHGDYLYEVAKQEKIDNE